MNKTEHSGPKKGRGGFYGPKRRATASSKRKRRERGKQDIRKALDLRSR